MKLIVSLRPHALPSRCAISSRRIQSFFFSWDTSFLSCSRSRDIFNNVSLAFKPDLGLCFAKYKGDIARAVGAEMLPREVRSLGFGLLACANAVGDMASSVYVGYLLEAGQSTLAFGIAAGVGVLGMIWLLMTRQRMKMGTS